MMRLKIQHVDAVTRSRIATPQPHARILFHVEFVNKS
jgi:hypothetical protein